MMMAPARRSTPTKALELINNLQPLDIYLHCQSILAYNRHKEEYKLDWTGINLKHPKLIGHRYFWQNLSYKLIFGLDATDKVECKNSKKDYHVIFFLVFPSALTLRTWGDPPGIIPWWTFTTPGTGAPLTGPPMCPCLLSVWPS